MWKEKTKIETLIGPRTRLDGKIQTKGTLRIDGFLGGGVTDAEEVIVGENGRINGDISAKRVVVAGTITGNLSASHGIELLPKSRINGDINTTYLSIVEGVMLNGKWTVIREKTEIINIQRTEGK